MRTGKLVGVIGGVVLAAAVGLSSFTIVPYGTVGVSKVFGKLGDETIAEGLHWKTPLVESIIQVNVQEQKAEVTAAAVSKDMQPITTKVTVNYSVDKAAANHLLQEVGTVYEAKVIAPNIQEVIKAVTARYSAEQLINKRDVVSSEIHTAMVKRMQPYGLNIVSINTTDLDFSDAFNASIEAKQVAAQKALQAENDLRRIETEAKQKVAQAKAEAEALKLKKQEVTPELIELKQIEIQEKALEVWDGKLPTVTGGATPFIDLGSATTK